MSRYAEGKSQRGFVVEDITWEEAAAVAEARGESVSEVIRRALVAYAAKGVPAQRKAPRKNVSAAAKKRAR